MVKQQISLEKIAEEHFSKINEVPLVKAVYEEMTDENMFDFFSIDNVLVRKVAARRISRQIREPLFLERLIKRLSGDSKEKEGILTSLSYIPLPDDGRLFDEVRKSLYSNNSKIKFAASKVISYRYPERAEVLIPVMRNLKDGDIAKIACYSQNPKLVWAIADYFNFPEEIHPALGFLLNPVWLAKNYNKDKENVGKLITKYGYAQEIFDKTIDFLAEGFMFVSPGMFEKDQSSLQRRIQDFLWQLLPDMAQTNYKHNGFLNINNELDRDIFFAAVRTADVDNINAKRDKDPFSYRVLESKATALCCHSPYNYYKRILIDEGLILAEKLKVEKDNLGLFLTERARACLELDDEAKVEAEALLMAKWLALSKTGYSFSNPRSYPIKNDEDFPLLKFGVIQPKEVKERNRKVSVGANSVLNLANYFGIDGLDEKIVEFEELYSKFLLPVGIEIQVPGSKIDTCLGFKQALRYFDIPSPRRPEYKEMVEAAFRPARSFHSFVLGPILLHKLGIFNYAQEMAFHISIQGDLGEEVRYLAFPHQFYNRRRKKTLEQDARFAAMARLMSKGFVNLNKDVEPCFGNDKPECRTEIRVCGCFSDSIDGKVGLRLSYIDDLISTHLLASASLNFEFKGLWNEYKSEIEKYTLTLPEEFSKLLYSNWYEATGDPRDGRLVGMLPIIKNREILLERLVKDGNIEEIGEMFESIVGKYSKEVHDLIVEKHCKEKDFSGFSHCKYNIPFYIPGELEKGILNNHYFA